MSEDAVVDGLPLSAVWEFWCLREWDMRTPFTPPPEPPLEEWPRAARETLERIQRRMRGEKDG